MALGFLNGRKLNANTLNSGQDNVYPINLPVEDICLGEFNAAPVNSYEINGCRFFTTMAPQTILRFAQLVGSVVPGTVLTLQQLVELRMATSGTVLSCQQSVKTTLPAANAFVLTQLVDEAGSFLDVYGWDASISIAGAEVPKDRISGNIVITKESNQNTYVSLK